MEASAVDWSMRDRAPGLIDWPAASQVGRTFAGAGPAATAEGRAGMRDDIAAAVVRADVLVREWTLMSAPGPDARAWVTGRGDWIDANLQSLERAVEPMLVRTIEAHGGRSRAAFRNKALGAQVGALFGYVSRKVMGQFDPFLPPDDEGLIYFVGPNILEAERRFDFMPEDFRLWLSLHELTHRVQFAHANWLRGHILTMIDSYLQMTDLDPKRVAANLRRAVAEARAGGSFRAGWMHVVMSGEQQALFQRMQATMSLVEGHASYVMNAVGADHIPTLERMRRSLEARRTVGGVERMFQQAIGFDHKVRQYGAGEVFVRDVVDRAGMATFNRVWETPANLPTTEEVAEPSRWLARVG